MKKKIEIGLFALMVGMCIALASLTIGYCTGVDQAVNDINEMEKYQYYTVGEKMKIEKFFSDESLEEFYNEDYEMREKEEKEEKAEKSPWWQFWK